MSMPHLRCAAALVAAAWLPAAEPADRRPCRIAVVEQGSGWAVPLVELRTTGQVRFVTDNAGVIAFDLPELMGQETWFDVIGHGYEVAKDGFGYRGVRLVPRPGATLTVEVKRSIVARRVGRLTGSGLFAESQACGEAADWRDSGVVGCDSVQCVWYRGHLHWLWGDTNLPGYPLGIFSSSGATSAAPAAESLAPPLRLAFDYFRDEHGKPRGTAPLPGPGPTWVFGMVAMTDRSGAERLGGCYTKIQGTLDAYQAGLTVWNDERRVFEPLRVLWERSSGKPRPAALPDGQAVAWHEAAGKDWLLFGNPFPHLRCPASFEAWQDPTTWETLAPQPSVPDAGGGEAVVPHTGCIGWHPWRKRWVTVFMQRYGKPSAFGELWYAEADQPTGPWGPAVKVLSHDNYTFYNPRLHLDFTPAGKPWLFFEGSYTTLFADHPAPTPRYDYNQILYRLDLDDPALAASRGR